MTRTVLFDQSNIAMRMGTGIATYGRNLARAARACGYATDTLLSADSKPDPKNPILSEVALFDAARKPVAPWLQDAQDTVGGIVNGLTGHRPAAFAHANVVIRPANEGGPPTGRTFVAPRLFEQSRNWFSITGRPARVRMETPPTLFHASHPLALSVKGCPNIVTVHDLVPLRLPYATLDNKRYFYRLIRHLLDSSDHIVTVSEFSRRDIIELFNIPERRITNTYQSVSVPADVLARDDASVANEISNLFELEQDGYFLFVGALEPKKNVGRLIDAYAASGSRRPLVIAGGAGWQNETELERIGDPRFASWKITANTISSYRQVRRIPYLRSEQLFTLMRGARALLFPSLYEGFGLPVLEAMGLGTPVLTSTVASLPEVAGDAALLVDPYDLRALRDGLRRLDADDDLCAELSVRGRAQAARFSADIYAGRIGAVYDAVLGRG